jgi:hypothetical protein
MTSRAAAEPEKGTLFPDQSLMRKISLTLRMRGICRNAEPYVLTFNLAATGPLNKAVSPDDKADSRLTSNPPQIPEDSTATSEKSAIAEPDNTTHPKALADEEPSKTEYYNTGEKRQSAASLQNEKAQVAPAGDQVVDDEEEESGAHHVHGIPLILLAFGLCVTTFLIGLDQMIIATAIPKITTQFDSIGDVGWYDETLSHCEPQV